MVDPRFRGPLLVTLGAVVAVVGTFLPWLRSGSRDRSSYAIFDLVERLGFAPGGVMSWSLRLWPLVPLVLVGGVVSAWWAHQGRELFALHLALSVAAVAWLSATAAGVLLAPDVALFRIGIGPPVTACGAIGIALGTAWITRRGWGSRAAS